MPAGVRSGVVLKQAAHRTTSRKFAAKSCNASCRLTPDFPPELVEFDALCLTRDVARRADTEYLLAGGLTVC